tara:strand:- start:224 stop:451 length:228 start_codon:yes stop_codon:yes gene_type:complete
MKEMEKYLQDYFSDWNLSEEEKSDLNIICQTASNKLIPLYSLMEKMSESTEFRESIIDTIAETLAEKKDDNKTDT